MEQQEQCLDNIGEAMGMLMSMHYELGRMYNEVLHGNVTLPANEETYFTNLARTIKGKLKELDNDEVYNMQDMLWTTTN